MVIDALRSAQDFFAGPPSLREFLYQLSAQLAVIVTTCFITFEGDPEARALQDDLVTADVILGLSYDPSRLGQERRVQVLKARGSASLLGGELTIGTSTVLAGNVGTGKSLLGLTWLLEGAALVQPGLMCFSHFAARLHEYTIQGTCFLVGAPKTDSEGVLMGIPWSGRGCEGVL